MKDVDSLRLLPDEVRTVVELLIVNGWDDVEFSSWREFSDEPGLYGVLRPVPGPWTYSVTAERDPKWRLKCKWADGRVQYRLVDMHSHVTGWAYVVEPFELQGVVRDIEATLLRWGNVIEIDVIDDDW